MITAGVFKAVRAREKAQVRSLGQTIGYGNLMDLASECWREDLYTHPGGQLVVGPAAASTVPCGCAMPHECEWCAGCSWLTVHVKAVKDTIAAVQVRQAEQEEAR